MKNIINTIKRIWQDERGAVNTVELIGYTILIAGAASIVGFGLTAAYRGLTGSVVKEIMKINPEDTP